MEYLEFILCLYSIKNVPSYKCLQSCWAFTHNSVNWRRVYFVYKTNLCTINIFPGLLSLVYINMETWKKIGIFWAIIKRNCTTYLYWSPVFLLTEVRSTYYYFANTTFWLFPLLCCWSKYVHTYMLCILHTYLLCVWDRKSVRPKRTSLIGRGNVTPFALKAFLGVQNFPNRNSQLKKLFTDTCVFILISCPTSTLSM